MTGADDTTIRVLVAEDNEDHLFLTVSALERLEGVELEVSAVRDGEEALDYVHGRGRYEGRPRPHLVLLDIRMPRLTGLEVLAELKQHPDLRKIPVVVLTSSDSRADVNTTYSLGGNSFVTKPVGVEALRQGIKDLADYWTLTAALPDPPA